MTDNRTPHTAGYSILRTHLRNDHGADHVEGSPGAGAHLETLAEWHREDHANLPDLPVPHSHPVGVPVPDVGDPHPSLVFLDPPREVCADCGEDPHTSPPCKNL